MKKRILEIQKENFKLAKESCISSYIDSEERKLDAMLQDTQATGDVITKDNIHLYYEFMSDDDLENYNSLIDDILKDRIVKIHTALNIDFLDFIDNYIASSFFEDNYISLISFGVKDTLKPINEYIVEIKESDIYKAYIANNS